MRASRLIVLAAVCFAALTITFTPLLAGQQPAGPPPVLTIYREEIKAGHRGGYMQTAAAWPEAFRRAGFPGHYIALTSMTGPAEAWFLEGAGSMAEIESRDKFIEESGLAAQIASFSAADGAHMSGGRALRANYMPGISYNAGVDLAKIRYFTVVVTRIRPGHGPAYMDMMRKVKAAHEKAGLSENYAVFGVGQGMPAGTFLMFIPVTSMKRIDELNEEHSTKLQAAFTDEDREMMNKVQKEAVLFSETNTFAVNPRLSYVSDEVRKRDPEFWGK